MNLARFADATSGGDTEEVPLTGAFCSPVVHLPQTHFSPTATVKEA
jgi:hypothetical protein